MPSRKSVLAVAAAATALIPTAAAQYKLVDNYSGTDFFSGWDFFTGGDPTHGYVTFLDQSSAHSAGLINATAQHAYMGVDSKTTLNPSGAGRKSVRITSKKSYTTGLIIGDFAHMPGGQCGSWPAFWTVGPNWPSQGEIDIIEGINSNNYDTSTLHTGDGCTVSGAGQTDTMATNNCYQYAAGENGSGCGMVDRDANSYGKGFNAGGGGVYATEWTNQAIKIWYFPRGKIPADITNNNPTPSKWGTPNANFQGSCNIASHFSGHQIVFDTTFCGDWAGNAWGSDSTCAPLASSCVNYVASHPGAFADTYWLVNYVKVFKQQSSSGPEQPEALPSVAPQPGIAYLANDAAGAIDGPGVTAQPVATAAPHHSGFTTVKKN